jgi:hypothetical protein
MFSDISERHLDRSRIGRNPRPIPKADPIPLHRGPAQTPSHFDRRRETPSRRVAIQFRFRFRVLPSRRPTETASLRLRLHRRNLSRSGDRPVRPVHQEPVSGGGEFAFTIITVKLMLSFTVNVIVQLMLSIYQFHYYYDSVDPLLITVNVII